MGSRIDPSSERSFTAFYDATWPRWSSLPPQLTEWSGFITRALALHTLEVPTTDGAPPLGVQVEVADLISAEYWSPTR